MNPHGDTHCPIYTTPIDLTDEGTCPRCGGGFDQLVRDIFVGATGQAYQAGYMQALTAAPEVIVQVDHETAESLWALTAVPLYELGRGEAVRRAEPAPRPDPNGDYGIRGRLREIIADN